MIENRNSNDYLHTDVILQKITDYDIFRYYCPNFKELGKKFTSDLREDKSPSVSIVKWNNKLLYKDFGHPDHTFDCFSYVRAKFNCEFYSALRIIDTDFNLKLSTRNDEIAFTMGYIGYSINKPIYEKKETIVQKRKRNWNYADEKYWSKYLISKKILSTFGVEPITHYWINGIGLATNIKYMHLMKKMVNGLVTQIKKLFKAIINCLKKGISVLLHHLSRTLCAYSKWVSPLSPCNQKCKCQKKPSSKRYKKGSKK